VVAHRWESDGHTTDAIGQLLDTVNVPPPALLPTLWAPLGLRYHGLHHLLPAMPYHRLGEAHRRLVAGLTPASPYHRSLNRSGGEAFRRMVGRTFTLHAPQS
jgi:fatty acid desaturase